MTVAVRVVQGVTTVLALMLFLLLPAAAVEEIAVPPFTGYVTDLAGLLPPARAGALERTLASYEEQHGSQVAVLTVPTTAGEAIEAYALRVVEAWKPGRKDVDDGVLLLVARDDRQIRIEVGYGLEGALTDTTCKRIIDETMAPAFRRDDYAGGIEAGVRAILAVAAGEALPPPVRAQGGPGPWATGLFLALFFAMLFRSGGAWRPFAALAGGAACGVVTMKATGMPVAALAAGAAAVVLAYLLGGLGGGGWASPGAHGAFPLGGRNTGFGGSRGFSGGGGRFGGGGASGGW